MLPRKINVTVKGVTKVTTSLPDNISVRGCVPGVVVGDYNKLRNLPTLNGEVIKGDKTSFDFKLAYIHEQGEASDTWQITHNLKRFPSVTVVDSGDNVVIGFIAYLDDNSLEIKFNGAFKGKAYLNQEKENGQQKYVG